MRVVLWVIKELPHQYVWLKTPQGVFSSFYETEVYYYNFRSTRSDRKTRVNTPRIAGLLLSRQNILVITKNSYNDWRKEVQSEKHKMDWMGCVTYAFQSIQSDGSLDRCAVVAQRLFFTLQLI